MAKLVIAMDVPDADRAFGMLGNFTGLPVWVKVGLELFTAEGPDLVRRMKKSGFPVFLDLKFHDIPNTVCGAVRSASRLGADMLTLHATGGPAMAEAALSGRHEALKSDPESARPLLLAVTLLTSEAVPGAKELVLERALAAKDWGLDGVVCSGLEAAAVKAACGEDFFCLTPGIRFSGAQAGDQARVCSPEEAVAAGADFLVMGRPILGAADPAKMAKQALSLMNRGK